MAEASARCISDGCIQPIFSPLPPSETRRAQQAGIDLAGDVALEAAHDLFLCPAFGGPPGDVVLGGPVAVHADQGDAPQGAACVAIAAAVQSMPVGAAWGDPGPRDAAQACERTLRA